MGDQGIGREELSGLLCQSIVRRVSERPGMPLPELLSFPGLPTPFVRESVDRLRSSGALRWRGDSPQQGARQPPGRVGLLSDPVPRPVPAVYPDSSGWPLCPHL